MYYSSVNWCYCLRIVCGRTESTTVARATCIHAKNVLPPNNNSINFISGQPQIQINHRLCIGVGLGIRFRCKLRSAHRATLVAHKNVTTAKLWFGVQLTYSAMPMHCTDLCAAAAFVRAANAKTYNSNIFIVLYSAFAIADKLMQHEKSGCGFFVLRALPIPVAKKR